MQKTTPCLWFDTDGDEAARFYTSVFPNSKIVKVTHYGSAGPRPAGTVMTVEFEPDKYSLSWQIVPTALTRFLDDPDTEKAQRVMAAMLEMKKIDIETLERAAEKVAASA